MTIAISVEKAHELISLITGNSNLNLAESRVELFGVDLVVAVEGIEVPEGSAETSDGLCTTGFDLFPDSFENYR